MKQLTFGVVLAVLFLISSTVAQTADAKSTKPTIVLVHGAWADGSSWSKVINPLENAGYRVIAVQNPTTSLADDLAATMTAIDRAGGDIILVGHSWGGFVITEAGADPRVKALVYVAAFSPDKGETITSLGEKAAPNELGKFLQQTNGTLTLTREGVAKSFAADLNAKEQSVIFAVQTPASPKIFAESAVNPSWKTKPSWFVVATEDKAIDPELQKMMAKRAGSKTTIVRASHVPMLSKPDEVLGVILDAAKNRSK
jgi:pimeloyl-ACP methyl ester carboxylesterase